METCEDNINNIYGYNNQCAPNCPIENRFFFDTDKICLKECLYYSIINSNLFICIDTCNAYVPNLDSNKKPLLCLEDNCNENYQYFIKEETSQNIIKKCYSECPKDFYYSNIKDSTNNIECYQKCQENQLYNFKDDNKCIPLSDCKF